MKKLVLMLAAAVAATGLVRAQEAAPDVEVTGADELVQRKGGLASTWVRPDADISRYGKLYLWEPEFSFREGGETTAGTTAKLVRGDSGPYAIRPEDQERFKQLVSEQFVAELARGKLFEVVNEVGPGTLIVRAGFLDITSDVPPNVERYGNVHLASVGEATIVFELIDASTGVIQARAAERQEISRSSGSAESTPRRPTRPRCGATSSAGPASRRRTSARRSRRRRRRRRSRRSHKFAARAPGAPATFGKKKAAPGGAARLSLLAGD